MPPWRSMMSSMRFTHVPSSRTGEPARVADTPLMREAWAELDDVERGIGLDPSLAPFPSTTRPPTIRMGMGGPKHLFSSSDSRDCLCCRSREVHGQRDSAYRQSIDKSKLVDHQNEQIDPSCKYLIYQRPTTESQAERIKTAWMSRSVGEKGPGAIRISGCLNKEILTGLTDRSEAEYARLLETCKPILIFPEEIDESPPAYPFRSQLRWG